jgi:hypothetical protein
MFNKSLLEYSNSDNPYRAAYKAGRTNGKNVVKQISGNFKDKEDFNRSTDAGYKREDDAENASDKAAAKGNFNRDAAEKAWKAGNKQGASEMRGKVGTNESTVEFLGGYITLI